ncbi:MAG: hypothetical protein AB1480_05955 [Nitrospirota bacterium]
MKVYKCIKCNNKTHQEDSICVICKIGITQMFSELVDLLKKDNRRKIQLSKTAGRS